MEKIYTVGRKLFYTTIAVLFTSSFLMGQEVVAWGYTCGAINESPSYPGFTFFNYDIPTGDPTIIAPASACGGPTGFLTGEVVEGVYYVIDNNTRGLYTINEAGECNAIATLSIGGGNVTALSHDPTSGTTYVTTDPGGGISNVYTVDLSTGAPSFIGTLPFILISLPIDASGNAFAIDLIADQIVPVDLSTVSVAGPAVNLNVGLNFAQDMDFDCDDTSNTLYGIIYSGGGDARYGTLDPTTGDFTQIQLLGPETCGFSIGVIPPAEELPVMTSWKGIAFGALILGMATLLLVGRMKL